MESPYLLGPNQNVVCKELQLAQPIEVFTAVELNTDGKLVPATSADTMIGVAAPQFGVVPPSTVLTPIADYTDLYVKGVTIGFVTTDVTQGQKLTLDTANPGYFKVAGATDPVVAIALGNATANSQVRILLL